MDKLTICFLFIFLTGNINGFNKKSNLLRNLDGLQDIKLDDASPSRAIRAANVPFLRRLSQRSPPAPHAPPAPQEQLKPPQNSIWYYIGVTRENFTKEHRDQFTPKVGMDISYEMQYSMENYIDFAESRVRYLDCSIASGAEKRNSKSDGASETQEEIKEMAEEETETLKDILDHVDLEGNGIRNVGEYRLPKYIQECKTTKMIMDIGDPTVDLQYRYLICSRLICLKTVEKMKMRNADTFEDFVNMFEQFLEGAVSFIHLYNEMFIEIQS